MAAQVRKVKRLLGKIPDVAVSGYVDIVGSFQKENFLEVFREVFAENFVQRGVGPFEESFRENFLVIWYLLCVLLKRIRKLLC